MEIADRVLVEQLLTENKNLARLYKRHSRIAKQIDELTGQPFLTSKDDVRLRNLKKQKLLGVDEMMRIIAPYRVPIAVAA